MKKLFLTLILFSTIYIPIIHNSETYDTAYLNCVYEIEDDWGITAGAVTSWFQVEYHPNGPVRLKEFFDLYQPNPTYRMTYFKWYGIPAQASFEVRHIWTENPNTDWQFTYTESVSHWKAITNIGESIEYGLNPVAFKKGHDRYPIDCIKIPYDKSNYLLHF